jgi:hypothetical protein
MHAYAWKALRDAIENPNQEFRPNVQFLNEPKFKGFTGGQQYPETGSPAGELIIKHFRIRGRRLRLCIDDYDKVTLWGPKELVKELADRILKSSKPGVIPSPGTREAKSRPVGS